MTEVADYETWTAEELRDELRARDLPATGNKPDLVARLKGSDAAAEAPPAAALTTGGPSGETAEQVAEDVRGQSAAARARQAEVAEGMCAVDDGSAHYADGRAIPGTAVCSAHEVNYTRDGSLRRPQ